MKDPPDYGSLYDAAMTRNEPARHDSGLGRVNGHTLLSKLGEGGMGVVWEAREPGTGRIVALKQLRYVDVATRGRRDAADARFQREIALAARLEHPGIARVYDSGIDEATGAPYFTMERIVGEPLPLDGVPESECLCRMAAICEAVEHAHRNGVIHRDLKPGNILVTPEGMPKILDFGVARALEESEIRSDLFGPDPALTLSRDGEVFGTPHFMAPEQARGESARCDTRTDVYALGATLFRQLTGDFVHPASDGANWKYLRSVAEKEPRPPAEVARQNGRRLARDVQAILMKALALAPNDRYDSAGELGRDLCRYLDGETVTAQPLTVSYWLGKHIRRHRGRWLAGVAVAAGLAVAVSVWFGQRERFLEEQVALRTQAEAGEKAARDSEVRSLIRVARQQWESGAKAEALAYLARAVRLDPDQREARASLMAAMKQFSTVYRASSSVKFQGTATHAAFSPDGTWFALGLGSEMTGLGIWDAVTLEERLIVPGNLRTVDLDIAPEGGYVAALLDHFNPSGMATVSVLILAGPNGILSQLEMPHAGGQLAFSQDGAKLAVSLQARDENRDTAGEVGIFDVRNPAEPKIVHPFRELSRPGFSKVFFSNRGKSLYFGKHEADARVWRWNLESGEIIRTEMRQGPAEWRPLFINRVLPDPSGDLFVTGQSEFVARWRDDGERQWTEWMDRVEGAVNFISLAASEDFTILAGGTSDARAVIWDARTGKRLAELSHPEKVEELRFCPGNPGLIATMTATGAVALWDWKRGKQIAEPIDGGERVVSMAFSPDGSRLLVGRGGHARMWSTIPRKWAPKVVDIGSPVDGVSFTGHATWFLATSHDSETVHLAEGYSGRVIDSWPHRSVYVHDRVRNRFAAITNREAGYAVTADSPRLLKVRYPSPSVDQSPLEIALKTDATAIATTRNGRYLAVGDADHRAWIFDLLPEEGTPPLQVAMIQGVGLPEWELRDWRLRFPERSGRFDNFVGHLAFSPNTSRLVMTEIPLGAVTAWNWREQKRIGQNPLLVDDYIAELQTTRNNRYALVCGRSFTIQTLGLDFGTEAGLRRLHRTSVTRLRIDRESQRLVTGAADGEVRFWDVEDARSRPTSRFRPGTDPILAMEMDEESVVCATGDAAGKIHLWLVKSGQPLCDPLDTGGAAVNDLAFHHRLPLLAAACADGKVRLWEIPTGRGKPPGSFAAAAESMGCLYLADDGNLKRGAIFFEDNEIENVARIHREHLKSRAMNPEMYAGEYQRLIFDLYRLPEIPPPVWLAPAVK
ncbi:MAG: protein kinase [Verrucomicrobiae bacterium]|nr:protein kinase [Verrucomicrobiae bacterium]